jgi:energy-coupling factor transporter transmembrane protein EcfT
MVIVLFFNKNVSRAQGFAHMPWALMILLIGFFVAEYVKAQAQSSAISNSLFFVILLFQIILFNWIVKRAAYLSLPKWTTQVPRGPYEEDGEISFTYHSRKELSPDELLEMWSKK